MNSIQQQTLCRWFGGLILLILPACNLWPTPQPEAILPTATIIPTLTGAPSPPPSPLPPTPNPSPSSPTPQPPSPNPHPPIPIPPTTSLTADDGVVMGQICYPGSRTPPITLYLENTATGDILKQKITPDQTTFTLTAPPGEYIAYAQTVGTALTGLYSEAVVCGDGPDCADHTPRPFRVDRQQTITSIDLCDWYNPPGVVSPQPGQATKTVRVTMLQNVNMFAGPGLAYEILTIVPARTSTQALGRSLDGDWLQIDVPSAGWVYAPLLQITAAPDTLPVIQAPPLPTPAAVPSLVPAADQFIPAAWSAAANAGMMHIKGFIRDEAGRPVNGFSILADNGTWSVLSHPTGPSNWFPDQQDGEWDIVVTNVTDAVGWWSLTVVSYDCPGFKEGFNAQCKQFTRLSKNQVIKIVYPDETVINADWVCRYNCDKGLAP